MSVILEVQDLKKYFKTAKGTLHAVDGISFQLEEGKTLGVVGESGCGKSTLGRTILHLLDSTGGKILFEGQDVTKLDKPALKKYREKMQIIFQDPFASLNPRMTAAETIMEPLMLRGGMSREAMLQETAGLMETVGLANRFANAYPHEMDGGRRQRIGIARALALRPKFVVCDEPVSALDVSIQAQVSGFAGGEEPDLYFCHPRFVCRQVYLRRDHGHVPGPDGGEGILRGSLRQSASPLHQGIAFRHPGAGGSLQKAADPS